MNGLSHKETPVLVALAHITGDNNGLSKQSALPP